MRGWRGGIISGHAKDMFGSDTDAFHPPAGLALVGIVIAMVRLGSEAPIHPAA